MTVSWWNLAGVTEYVVLMCIRLGSNGHGLERRGRGRQRYGGRNGHYGCETGASNLQLDQFWAGRSPQEQKALALHIHPP
jgi:hypothetical protein